VESLIVAEEQSALFWQLRTAMSLARLKQRLGREDDARQDLKLIYRRFTEGFATADLLAAKRLWREANRFRQMVSDSKKPVRK